MIKALTEEEKRIDADAIYWDLSLHGESIDFDRKCMVQSIVIDETVKGSDSMTITIADPDMVYIEDDIYIEDVPISCDITFQGRTEKACFYGYISEITPDFAEDGSPMIELYCLDKTHLMQRVKNTQTWENVRSIDVVREKCEGYGFKLVYQEDYEFLTQESISQSDQTDIEFLEQLASDERELFVAKLVGDTFFYIKLGLLADPSVQLYYRYDAYHNNIKSFKPTIDKESKKVDVRYADIDPATGDTTGYYANAATVALETQGYPVEVAEVPYGSVRYDDSANKKDGSSSDSDSAEREYRDIEYNTLRGEAELMPTADTIGMRYMTTANVAGFGKHLSGLYYVEGIKRTLDNSQGYSQTATLIKTGFGNSMKPVEVSAEVATESSTEYTVGDVIRFCNDNATYAHASEGMKVPAWVRSDTWKVSNVDNDGRCVLLGDIQSWVHMDDIEKA